MGNKKNVLKKMPELKKTVKGFLVDEDGFVSKETILKVGLATVGGLGMLGSMTSSFAGHTSSTSGHVSACNTVPAGAAGCFTIAHQNVAPAHTSHGSY
jgi:hypothetical protein